MKSVKISVVVPVYNTASYIKDCIESILGQSYQNLELVLVDDGSTDGSGAICDYYKEKDSRVRVVHQANQGATRARKEGLMLTTGDYISYIDSDDWLERDCYEKIIGEMSGEEDIVTFGYIKEYADHSEAIWDELQCGLYDGSQLERIKKEIVSDNRYFSMLIDPHTTTKIIKKRILRRCQMSIDDQIKVEEDIACLLPCIWLARSVYVTHDLSYHYRQRTGSLTKQFRDDMVNAEQIQKFYSGLLQWENHCHWRKRQIKLATFYLLLQKAYSKIEFDMELFPFPQIAAGDRVALYGLGELGRNLLKAVHQSSAVSLAYAVDRNFGNIHIPGCKVYPVEYLQENDFDYVIIAIGQGTISQLVKQKLLEMGIAPEKILTLDPTILAKHKLPDFLID